MLKLRKVELLGFKSFCEKTPITFSGTRNHLHRRAERVRQVQRGGRDLLGAGRAKPQDAPRRAHVGLHFQRHHASARRMGLSEVTLTLDDPELSEAVAKVIEATTSEPTAAESAGPPRLVEDNQEAPLTGLSGTGGCARRNGGHGQRGRLTERPKARRKRAAAEKPAVSLRPGEVVVGRRLYRSGQSEYLINGRVARLARRPRNFHGHRAWGRTATPSSSRAASARSSIRSRWTGGPSSKKPPESPCTKPSGGWRKRSSKHRRSIFRGSTTFYVEVEKQLASLKRQASKARRYAELREQMRGLLRIVLASKAEHLDIEAARLENLLRDMEAAEEREAALRARAGSRAGAA